MSQRRRETTATFRQLGEDLISCPSRVGSSALDLCGLPVGLDARVSDTSMRVHDDMSVSPERLRSTTRPLRLHP